MTATRRCVGLAILLAVGIGAALWLRPPADPVTAPPVQEDENDDVPPAANPGFVGIAVCAECHAKRVDQFHGTRHFHASQPGTDSPGFNAGKGTHITRDPNVRFEMSREADGLHAAGIRRTPEGDERIDYRIGLVYGSGGTRDEMYFAWQDNRLVQLPIAWLHPQQQWGNVVDRIEGREVGPNCLECHTTWAAHVPGSLNEYRPENLLPGVTCERCHGTGREHVEHHRTHPNAATHAILHPGKMDRERSMDLCAQCHTNVKRKGVPFGYRPGEPLADHFRVVRPRFEEDAIVGNQVGSLQASKCFQKSEMTCLTCHDPHGAESSAQVRDACRKCHDPAACKEQPRLPAEIRADCTACHLPKRVWMNVHFHTAGDQYVPVAARTDHRIGVHPWAAKERRLAWLRTRTDAASRAEADRLAEEIATHWLKEADQLQRAGRFVAEIGAVREALKLAAGETARTRLQQAITRQAAFEALKRKVDPRQPEQAVFDLKRVLELRPGYAWAHHRLGSLHAALGNRAEAVANWEAVATNDPEDASGLIQMASMEMIDGRPESAIALLSRADEIDPGHARLHFLWGSASAKLGRHEEAKLHLARTLAIQPNHPDANRLWAEAMRRDGRKAEADRFERKAARLTSEREIDR
ncbi:MAG: tetratricopeptide repeat protein [Gemmataceae bacterium]